MYTRFIKEYLILIAIFFVFALSCETFAEDEVDETPINSSFVGDISNSMVDDSSGNRDVARKTDGEFVGQDPGEEDNSLFAGDGFDRQVRENKDAPFEQDRTQTQSSDGVFVGEGDQKQTGS